MFKENFFIKRYNIFFYIIILSFGFYLSSLKGYGSDRDSPALISAFINFLEQDIYFPSRGYGHPIAEFIIGFLAYNFGATVSTYFSFIAFFLSLIFFYKSFEDFFNEERLNIFILLCISNSFLLFDNINSSDFPWSLFFFSLGFFLMRKEKYLYCCVFFALCVGCRYNFIIFVYAALFSHYLINSSKLSFKKFLFLSFLTLVIIFIIFFPINFLYSEKISYNFSSRVATPGDGYNLGSLVPRFIYKNFKLFGVFSGFFILYFFIKEFFFKRKIKEKIFKYSILIILLNFLIFLIFPAKIAYLHSGIILIYILITFVLKKKFLYLIIVLNFLQWVITYDIIRITYKYDDPCMAVHAISATIDPHFKLGEYNQMISKIDIKNCESKNYSEGLPYKFKK
tara:strand:+ start:538 stop:1725 length:1188 start_codon:yes stop_codon:yes gene_type:complete